MSLQVPLVESPASSESMTPSAGGVCHSLQNHCNRIRQKCTSRPELLSQFSNLVVEAIRPDFVAHLFICSTGEVEIEGLSGPAHGLAETRLQQLKQLGLKACTSGFTQQIVLKNGSTQRLIVVPIPGRIRSVDAIAAYVSTNETTAEAAAAILEIVTGQIALRDREVEFLKAENQAESASAVIELTSALLESQTLAEAEQRLVSLLADFLDVESVALFYSPNEHKNFCMRAATGRKVTQVDENERQRLESIANEVFLEGRAVAVPDEAGKTPRGLLTLKQFQREFHCEGILAVPVHSLNSEGHYVLVVWGPASICSPPDIVHFLTAAAESISQALEAVNRIQSNWLHRRWMALQHSVRTQRGQWISLGLVLASALLCVPVPYWVNCECEIQPAIRRFVSAPFEGTLEESFVKPGDVVVSGQLLARLDGQEIDWKRAEIAAEIHRAQKERDGHLAANEYGSAEVSRFDEERFRIQSMLLDHRGNHLEIRSPVAGLVIEGDLDRAQGAPVTMGQSLFEIAPLEQMHAEIRIPESEIAYVTSSMPIRMKLFAYPGRKWDATLETIHPNAESIEDDHVFVGEVEFENPEELLRPGMRGQVWIKSDARPLGWNLFHRAWESALAWMGW